MYAASTKYVLWRNTVASTALHLPVGARLVGLGRILGLEHAEHPVRDQETADHVDRAEGDGDDEQDLLKYSTGLSDQEQAADHDDAVDRVRPRHQRRMQRVG